MAVSSTNDTPHTVVQEVCNTKPLSRLGLAAVQALPRSPAWHARFEGVLYDMMAAILREQHLGMVLGYWNALFPPATLAHNIHPEHRWRTLGVLPTVAEWWPIRRAVAGGIFGATLVEHALDAELPAEALADERVKRIIELAGAGAWCQVPHSLLKLATQASW